MWHEIFLIAQMPDIITEDPSSPPTYPTQSGTQSEVVSLSCSTSTALASVITAIVTALLATVIFVLVQIAICKCHTRQKFSPGGAGAVASAGGEEQDYEQMGGRGEGGVVMGESSYEYVGVKQGKRNTIQLQENKAYASFT